MPFQPRTIHFISLGCAKNRVDSEVMAGVARQRGLKVVVAPEEADIVVVNTCAFIEPAREESVDALIKTAGRLKKGGLLVAAGCLAQRYVKELAEDMPEISHILGTSELPRLADIIDGAASRIEVKERGHFLQTAATPRFIEPGAVSAYLKIADGCSRRCAFCAIPGIRGKAGSRPIGDVVEEAKRLVRSGVKELNLVAQDTAAYGRDLGDGTDLVSLITSLDEISGSFWVRLLYLYPDAVTDALIDAVARSSHVVPYFDIPIQHASFAMLKLMRRGHGPSTLRRLIARIRERVPMASIRTAVLVGHPGEKPADVELLLEFIEWARFEHLGAFRYSREEETASFDMADPVSARESYNRYRKVMSLQRRVSRASQRELVGRVVEVLVEGPADEHGYVLVGRHAGQAPEVDGLTYLASTQARPGDIVRARVVKSDGVDLVAESVVD